MAPSVTRSRSFTNEQRSRRQKGYSMKRRYALGLPLSDPRGAWLACAAVLASYALSMQRGLGSFDSPELALVARTLGLGHPPGQPLHTLLGFVFAHLPGLPPLVGLNLLSALCGALTVLPMLCLCEWLLAREGAPSRQSLRYAAGAIVLGALHGALWEPATRIEVYPLATLCALWACAWIVTVAGVDASAQATPKREGSGTEGAVGGSAERARAHGSWFAAGVALGLSASANPVIASLALLALAPGLWRRLWARQLGPRGVGWALVGGLVGLLPYGYVFVVAHRTDVLVWGRPIDLASLQHYFTLADFAQNNRLAAAELLSHLGEWLGWTATRGALPVFALGAAACWWFGRGGGRDDGWLALGSVVWTSLFLATNVVWRPDNPDFLGYQAAPFALGVVGVAATVGRLTQRLRRARLALAALFTLTLIAPAPTPLWLRARHADQFTDALARTTLDELPPRAILVSESDHLGFALLYLQLAEGRRRDVVHLAWGLSSSSWYWELLWRRHPDLGPIALRGPGGKGGRARRLFARHPARPVLFERSELALAFAPGALCSVGWSVGTGSYCARSQARRRPERAPELAGALARLGDGAPFVAELIAMVAEQLGATYWRAGQLRPALDALRAGVAARDLPPLTLSGQALLATPPPPPGWPSWRRAALLGDPARNLYLAAVLLHGAGADSAARAHLAAAARLELPEALGRGAP